MIHNVPDGTAVCRQCRNLYNSVDVGEDGVCIDCREGCCGTSKAPPGWFCTRPVHDDGPCAAMAIHGHDHWTFANCLDVKCQCWEPSPGCPCPGKLRSSGRNVKDTLTFLICDVCSCAYVAEDAKREGA